MYLVGRHTADPKRALRHQGRIIQAELWAIHDVILQGVGESPTETSYSQFYGKFRTKAPDIKELMKEIETRSSKGTE